MLYSEIPGNSMLKTGITFKDWPRESGVIIVWIKLVIGENSPKDQIYNSLAATLILVFWSANAQFSSNLEIFFWLGIRKTFVTT